MSTVIKSRLAAFVSAVAVATLCFAAIDVLPAGASPSTAVSSQAPTANGGQAIRAKSAVGTYEWFLGSSGAGEITLASNNTWTSSEFSDSGSWLVSGKTIALSDLVSGGGTLMATLGKHGLGTANKPGPYVFTSGTSGTWYAVKVS